MAPAAISRESHEGLYGFAMAGDGLFDLAWRGV